MMKAEWEHLFKDLLVKRILIIGGTRNVGYFTALRLMAAGHQVTVLNRGMSPDDLPPELPRLRADRTNPQQMKRALLAKTFDVVVDFVMYREAEAAMMLELLRDQVGHYIVISSGQVYLVRQGLERPFKETDYPGRLMPAPKVGTYAYEEWSYGMDKRAVEDVFIAHPEFPCTRLRLPMVNSERDPMKRLYQYFLRIKDGGPLLVPETPDLPLRHVYQDDVVRAIERLIETGDGKGDAINLCQDEMLSLPEFIALLAEIKGRPMPRLVWVKYSQLEAAGFLPDCSPFSDRWMSVMDNTYSKERYGITYTPLPQALEAIVRYYRQHPPSLPSSYKRRYAEIEFAAQVAKA